MLLPCIRIQSGSPAVCIRRGARLLQRPGAIRVPV